MRNRPFLQAFLIGIFLPVLYLSLSAAAFGIAEGNGVSALEYSFLSFYFVLFWIKVKSEINATVLAKCSSSNRDGIAQLQMEVCRSIMRVFGPLSFTPEHNVL